MKSNSNSNTVRRAFSPSFGSLHRDARRLLQALNDSTIGAPVVARLPATFVADFTAQLALVAQLGSDQSHATGTAGVLTQAQRQALADYVRLASSARRSAKLAFPGQNTLLRSEFMVGEPVSKSLASTLAGARCLAAACQKHADDLAPHGWHPADAVALQAAVDALAGADVDQGTATDVRQGVTAQRVTAANALYQQCLVVQNGARIVYPLRGTDADAAVVEARARFLIGEFPTHSSASPNPAPVTAAAPASPPATETHPLAG